MSQFNDLRVGIAITADAFEKCEQFRHIFILHFTCELEIGVVPLLPGARRALDVRCFLEKHVLLSIEKNPLNSPFVPMFRRLDLAIR